MKENLPFPEPESKDIEQSLMKVIKPRVRARSVKGNELQEWNQYIDEGETAAPECSKRIRLDPSKGPFYPGPKQKSSKTLKPPHPPPICQMCQENLTLFNPFILQIFESPSTPSLKHPFACFATFSTLAARTEKILNDDCSVSINYNCPICDEDNSSYSQLEIHLYTYHQPLCLSEERNPHYIMTTPIDYIIRKYKRDPKNHENHLNSTVNCMKCALKFQGIRKFLHHLQTNHDKSRKSSKFSRSTLSGSEDDDLCLGFAESSNEELWHHNAQLEEYELSMKELSRLHKSSEPSSDIKCDDSSDLSQIKNHQDGMEIVNVNDSPEEIYENYEYLEELPEDNPSDSISPSPESIEILEEEPTKNPPSILEWLLTPDITSNESTTSEESKYQSLSSSNSLITSQAPHKTFGSSSLSRKVHLQQVKIIDDSRTFDLKTKLYLSKLQRDHKCLMNAKTSQNTSISLENVNSLFSETVETKEPGQKRLRSLCTKAFKNMKDLAGHFNFTQVCEKIPPKGSIWPQNLKWCQCSQCDKTFKTQELLISHQYFVHADESMVHICDNCCKFLTSILMVNNHECTNADSFTCRICCLIFKNGQELLAHNQKHHLEKLGSHLCPFCGKKFLTKSMMNRHVRDLCHNKFQRFDINDNDDGVCNLEVKDCLNDGLKTQKMFDGGEDFRSLVKSACESGETLHHMKNLMDREVIGETEGEPKGRESQNGSVDGFEEIED